MLAEWSPGDEPPTGPDTRPAPTAREGTPMPTPRPWLSIIGFALVLAGLSGCTTTMDLVPLWSTAGPTSEESKQHWDMTMAGITAKSEPDTRQGLKLLSSDARSMQMSANDRDYMLERLQRVSFEIDKDDWIGAQNELQTLRWRYGRF